MKNKKYHTVETIPKSNIKIGERGKITEITRNTHIRSCAIDLIMFIFMTTASQINDISPYYCDMHLDDTTYLSRNFHLTIAIYQHAHLEISTWL